MTPSAKQSLMDMAPKYILEQVKTFVKKCYVLIICCSAIATHKNCRKIRLPCLWGAMTFNGTTDKMKCHMTLSELFCLLVCLSVCLSQALPLTLLHFLIGLFGLLVVILPY